MYKKVLDLMKKGAEMRIYTNKLILLNVAEVQQHIA